MRLSANQKLPRCNVCRSVRRVDVEHGLANAIGVRVLARRFNLSKDTLARHRRHHMPANLVASLKAGAHVMMDERELDALRISESKSLLGHLVAQRGRLTDLVTRALKATDYRAATAAENAIGSNLERTGKLLGEFGEATRNVVNNNTLVVSDQYLTLRRLLIEALRPAEFKAARLAVARALSIVESGKPETKQIASIEIEAADIAGALRPRLALLRQDESYPAPAPEHGSVLVNTDEGPYLPTRVVASEKAAESAILEAVTAEQDSAVITLVR